VSLQIDTASPGTIEDIERKTPSSDHTGNVRRLLVMDASPEALETTTTANVSRLHGGAAMGAGVARTQGDGEDQFHLLCYLQSRLAEPALVHHALLARSGLLIQVSRRAQDRLSRLMVDPLWRASGEILISLEAFVSNWDVLSMGAAVHADPAGWEDAERSRVMGQAFTVGEALQQLRSIVDLPVQDLARMCGVGRRQFYNLMNGISQPPPTQERRIRELVGLLTQLHETLGSDSSRVRSMVLTPLGEAIGSFYDAACSGDSSQVVSAFSTLLASAAEDKKSAPILPPSGRLAAGASMDDAIELLRSRGSSSLPHEPLDEQ
jgi:hypothetical protein